MMENTKKQHDDLHPKFQQFITSLQFAHELLL